MRYRFVVFVALLSIAAACTQSSESTVPEAGSDRSGVLVAPPMVPKGVQAIAAIGNVHGLFDGAGHIARSIDSSLNGAALRNMVGGMIGDPELEAFDGRGLAVVAFDANEFALIAPLDESAAQGYAALLQGVGMQSKFEDGWLYAGPSPTAIDSAKAVKSDVESYLKSCGSRLRIAGRVADLIAPFDSRIELMMGSLAEMVPEQGATPGADKVLEIEARVFYSLLKQIDVLELAIAASDEGVDLSGTFTARAGSNMEKFVSASSQPFDLSLFNRLSGDGAMRMGWQFDMDSMIEVLSTEIRGALAKMNYEGEEFQQAFAMMESWKGVYGDTVAIDALHEGKGLMSQTGLFKVKDTEKLTDLMEEISKSFSEGGSFHSMYKELGQEMSMNFTRNARKSGDTDVHAIQIEVKLDDTLPPEQLELMKQMMGGMTVEYCELGDDWVGYALSTEDTDALVSNSLEGGKLASAEAFGEGGFAYLDFDFGPLLKMVSAMTPMAAVGPEMQRVFAMLHGVPAVAVAGFSSGSTGKMIIRLPKDMITRIAMLSAMTQSELAPAPETGTRPR